MRLAREKLARKGASAHSCLPRSHNHPLSPKRNRHGASKPVRLGAQHRYLAAYDQARLRQNLFASQAQLQKSGSSYRRQPAAVSLAALTGFGFTPSHFLFACAKEKVTKEKAHPASGFRCAKLPSFRHCSEGRHGGPSLAHRSSFGIHAKRPSAQHLRSAS